MAAPPPSDLSTPRAPRPPGSVNLRILWISLGPSECLRLVGALWSAREAMRQRAKAEGREYRHVAGPGWEMLQWMSGQRGWGFNRDWGLRGPPGNTWMLAQAVAFGMTQHALDVFQDAVDEVRLPEVQVRAKMRSLFGFKISVVRRLAENVGEDAAGLHFWAVDADGSVVEGPTVPMEPDADWSDVKAAGDAFEARLKAGEVSDGRT